MELTPLQAAQQLNVTRTRIYGLIRSGALEAWMDDGRWVVDPDSVAEYKRTRRGRGRPRKDDVES